MTKFLRRETMSPNKAQSDFDIRENYVLGTEVISTRNRGYLPGKIGTPTEVRFSIAEIWLSAVQLKTNII